MKSPNAIADAADRLWSASETGDYCGPVRDLIGDDLDAAYAVQLSNVERWQRNGRRLVGRKIGLTSKAVQKQLGVDQPDYGALFADMEFADGAVIPWERTHQPKAEAEIALVLGNDILQPDVTGSEMLSAIKWVVPAIEIVGSRIENWDIKISDTIADNASSGLYVLGGPYRSVDGIDLVGAKMVMKCNGVPVSFGAGSACLGSPLTAALWLARKCAELGAPLKQGDVILSGALGPMHALSPGDVVEAEIDQVGSVRAEMGQ